MVQGLLGQKCETLSEKLTKSKSTGGMAQVVELLPNKALSSNSSNIKKQCQAHTIMYNM
jgi:hypothetical protein